MRYAIVSFGGKQFKIKEGDTFEIERQKSINMDVLLFVDGSEVLIGEPFLTDITVTAKIVDEKRAPKVRVARFKSKSRYRKVKGHRQPLSVVEIEKISKKGEKVAKKPAAKPKTTKPKAPAKKKSSATKAKKTTTKAKPSSKKKEVKKGK